VSLTHLHRRRLFGLPGNQIRGRPGDWTPRGYRGPRGDWASRGWAAYYFESKAERIFGRSVNSAVKKKQMCKLHCICRSTELLSWLGELSSSVNVSLDCFFSVGLSRILMKLGTNDVMVRGYTVTQRILDICINYANCGKFVEIMKWLVDLRLLSSAFILLTFVLMFYTQQTLALCNCYFYRRA